MVQLLLLLVHLGLFVSVAQHQPVGYAEAIFPDNKERHASSTICLCLCLSCAYAGKYLSKIDKFCKRALKYGYTKERIVISDVIQTRDKQLWEKITHIDLTDLLPSKRTYQSLRQRGHDYILPRICTERFKRCFINRYLFNFI